MKKKFKFIIIFILVITIFLVGSNEILALNLTGYLEKVGVNATFEAKPNLAQTIGQIIKGVLSLLGVIFLILVIYAGFLWMTASGNDEQITKAKNILKASIIGVIIVMGAYAITYFVVDKIAESSGYSAITG